MLKINNQLNYPLIGIFTLIGGFFLFQYLTFIPEYSSAEEISTTKPIKTLTDITYMSELTPEICGNTQTPSAFLEDGITFNSNVPSKQLIDDRDNVENIKYWVSKLADGNCWTTQNMRYNSPNLYYPGLQVAVGFNMGLQSVGSATESTDPTLTEAFSDDRKSYNAHYLVGRYYSQPQSTAVCDFSSKGNSYWRVPGGKNNERGTIGGLVNATYKVNHVGSKMPQAPIYFITSGVVEQNNFYPNTDNSYWSSDYNLRLAFGSGFVYASYNYNGDQTSYGSSVRCIVDGDDTILPTPPSSIPDPNISVSIPSIIALDVSDSVDITTKSDEVNTGTFTAKVASNQDYSISLNAAGDSTSLINSKDGSKIAEIPTITTTQPTPGISSWGIRTCSGLDISSCTELPTFYFEVHRA